MGIGFISRMYLAFGVHDPCVVNITIARRSIVWDHDMIIAFAEIIVETISVDKWVDEAGEEGHVQLSEVDRSEEHTSELQSLMRISYAVFCLKKKNKQNTKTYRPDNLIITLQ